jgi:DNA repair exonuclease SbcCD ATPase subunit
MTKEQETLMDTMTKLAAETPATPETVWAILREVAALQKESARERKESERMLLERMQKESEERHKEMEERRKESAERYKEWERLHKETERAIEEVAEAHEETEKAIKNLSENIGKESVERYKEWERAHEETERAIERAIEEVAEEHKKTEQAIKNLSENIGGLNNSIGALVETLIAARLWEKFAGYNLQRAHRRVTVHGDDHRPRAEIDIVLTNTDCAIAVEVKREFDKIEDVERHLKRMELIRQYPPAVIKENSKRVMGAVAGGVVSPNVMEYAHEHGLFVLELSGESVRLAPAPAGFEPKVW